MAEVGGVASEIGGIPSYLGHLIFGSPTDESSA
jgi:hypothetical protein